MTFSQLADSHATLLFSADIDVVIAFSPTTYIGSEDERIHFNIVLRTPAMRAVTVLFSTESLSAGCKDSNYEDVLEQGAAVGKSVSSSGRN